MQTHRRCAQRMQRRRLCSPQAARQRIQTGAPRSSAPRAPCPEAARCRRIRQRTCRAEQQPAARAGGASRVCLGSRATTQGPQDTAAGGGASLRRPRASLRVLAAKERVSARPLPHIAQALCGPQPTSASASRPSRRRASGEAATSTGLSSGAGCAREKHAPDTGRGVVRGPSSTGSARSTRLSKLWGRGGGVQAWRRSAGATVSSV